MRKHKTILKQSTKTDKNFTRSDEVTKCLLCVEKPCFVFGWPKPSHKVCHVTCSRSLGLSSLWFAESTDELAQKYHSFHDFVWLSQAAFPVFLYLKHFRHKWVTEWRNPEKSDEDWFCWFHGCHWHLLHLLYLLSPSLLLFVRFQTKPWASPFTFASNSSSSSSSSSPVHPGFKNSKQSKETKCASCALSNFQKSLLCQIRRLYAETDWGFDGWVVHRCWSRVSNCVDQVEAQADSDFLPHFLHWIVAAIEVCWKAWT